MASYRELRAWQVAHEMAVGVYRLTAAWPPQERYGLTAQVRRAAFSAPANLVEGSMRRGAREFRRFADIAFGSISEVEYTLEFAEAIGLEQPGANVKLKQLVVSAGQLTCLLARGLDRHSRKGPAPPAEPTR
ncbi:MAG TPA: four helix bundle protein [Gemmatimonadales bacterium]|nr:four helix bundle protein [Gemmatimonadales bacterium]